MKDLREKETYFKLNTHHLIKQSMLFDYISSVLSHMHLQCLGSHQLPDSWQAKSLAD